MKIEINMTTETITIYCNAEELVEVHKILSNYPSFAVTVYINCKAFNTTTEPYAYPPHIPFSEWPHRTRQVYTTFNPCPVLPTTTDYAH
jgi:hypothetical protein